MARSNQTNGSETNGSDNAGSKTAAPKSVVELYSVATDGADIQSMFSAAHSAMAIGHRTLANVPFVRLYKEGDILTAGQAAFLSAALIRNSLGNDEYATVDEAAAIKIRDIPAQYSLLEDALDNITQRMLEAAKKDKGRRVDREGWVAKFLAAKSTAKMVAPAGQLVSEAVALELASLVMARKAVKGKKEAAPEAEVGALFTDE